jgi:geranylgeranyl pyrophosphate synthase
MSHPQSNDEETLNFDLGVEEIIENYIPRDGMPSSLHVPVWDLFDRGGKRFRPLLSHLCCKIVDGDTRIVMQLAAAVELLHNMTLIHDDIEDNSDRRRGKPCLHLTYGIPVAINTADSMAVKVFDMILSHDIRPEVKLLVLQKVVQRVAQMLYGQALEIENRETPFFDENVVLEIMKNKTAALVILASEIGMIMGKSSDVHLRLVERYAGYAGMAFQIIDDVLNLIADKKYGKEIGGDLQEGKRTVIISHFMSHASIVDTEMFAKYFGRKDASKEDMTLMLSLLKKYGSIEYSQDLADYYLKCGLYYLQFFPDNQARDSLTKLSKFLTKRNW